jgi:M6 family metalloprotease-like protein
MMEALKNVDRNTVQSNDDNLLMAGSGIDISSLTDELKKPFQTLQPTQDPTPLLTILWDPQWTGVPKPTEESIKSLLYGETNSVQDYFLENSNDQFTIENAGILGWYDADKPAEHYWNESPENDPKDTDGDGWLNGHVEKWAEAIRKADQDFNFANYDSNLDGNLTPDELGILIVIPSQQPNGFARHVVGQEFPSVKPLAVDGVEIAANDLGVSIAEVYFGSPPNLGLVSHELSHLLLGHSDMYFNFDTPFAAGEYSLMDQHWKAPHLDPFAKLKLGWVEPEIVTESGYYNITDIETNHNVWILMDPSKGTDEYFIIENRWTGNSYDSDMSDSGLAVWHIIEEPAIYGSQIPPTPPGSNQGLWEEKWQTISPHDWGRRAISMIKPVWNTFTNTQALWDGFDPATGYDLVSNNADPQKASLLWADGTPSGFALRNISGSAATMRVYIELPGSQPAIPSLIVDTLEDEDDNNISLGDVSLREAIRFVKSGGTIDFASNLTGSITLTQGELVINKDLIINSLGANKLTVSGNQASRIFNITGDDTTVNLNQVTISEGSADVGGGIFIDTGSTLNLTSSSISSNSAVNGGGIFNIGTLNLTDSTLANNSASGVGGGGIENVSNGTVTLTNSTVSGNSAQQGGGIENFGSTITLTNSTVSGNSANFGGGIHNGGGSIITLTNSTVSGNSVVNSGGGISNDGILNLTNSTVSNNSASNMGGGIDNSGTATLSNNTVFGNSATFGGGINTFGTVEVGNTIIAGNIGPTPDVRGAFNDRGNNLIGNNTGSSGFTISTLIGTSTNPIDPKLGSLQDNGGTTFTHALLSSSPAINAGNNADIPVGATTDQRGQARIVGGTVDIGAFETQTLITGSNGQKTFVINRGDTTIISDFGGVGRGTNPSAAVIAEVDRLKFQGVGLIAQNLILTQNGTDLEITFEDIADTKVVLQNFALENLDNLADLGNILFDGQTSIQDSFDVFDADSTRDTIFNQGTVTFLNDLDNKVTGFNNSNDVINGQTGNDRIDGRGGNDLLRGGLGNDTCLGSNGKDILIGGDGNDHLIGGNRKDSLTGGEGEDKFSFTFPTEGIDTITDFSVVNDIIQVSKAGFDGGLKKGILKAAQFVIGSAAKDQSDRFIYNQSTGELFFDVDGKGGTGQVQLAKLSTGLAMTNNDIQVIA